MIAAPSRQDMRPAGAPVIVCDGVSKVYRLGDQQVHALREVTLTVRAGEFVAVTGASGSGKSTLLNLIGALDTPTDGRLLVGGEDLSEMSLDALAELRNRMVGFVFQQFNLLPRASALDNVKLPLQYARLSRDEAERRARARLDEMGLAERMHHQPSQLSGGQQQRVAIARALVNDPQIILADEPTGALDSQTSQEIMALLHRLNERGLTVVLVTHEPDLAAQAGRLLRFHDGRLVADESNAGVRP
jgi:ABC-type lipoprotein export system ATPase subunit